MTSTSPKVLLVVKDWRSVCVLQDSVPEGWTVKAYCNTLAGYRGFDLILLPGFDDEGSDMRRAHANQWIIENLSLKLAVGGKIVRI